MTDAFLIAAPFRVGGRYAGATTHDCSGWRDCSTRTGADAVALELLNSGFHLVTIVEYDAGLYTPVSEWARRPRVGDRITGFDSVSGQRCTGRVVELVDLDPAADVETHYRLDDVRDGYGDGRRVDGDRVVRFEQFDATAVAGVDFDPAAVAAR